MGTWKFVVSVVR